jgi:hypothetical protein
MHKATIRRLIRDLETLLADSSDPGANKGERRARAGLLNKRQVAGLAKVSYSRVLDAISRGDIPAPSHRCGGGKWRYYTDDEAREIAQHFGKVGRGIGGTALIAAARRAAGLVSQGELAAMCGVAPVSIQYHRRIGRIPAPSRSYRCSTGYFYSADEASRIVENYKAWRAEHSFIPRGPRRASADDKF